MVKLKHRLYYWWLVLTGRKADRVTRWRFHEKCKSILYLGSAVWFHGQTRIDSREYSCYDVYYSIGEYYVVTNDYYLRPVSAIGNRHGFQDWFKRVFVEKFQYQLNLMLEVD